MGSGRPLLILHGLFGSLDNWKTLGLKFAKNYEVYLIDQRNHGKSPHSDLFDYQAMTDDLIEFIEDHYLRGTFIIGHSMGGKTLMNFAQHCELVDKIVIVDIAPKAYLPHHMALIKAMEGVDLDSVNKREEVEELLKIDIPNLSIRRFLMKNLYWKEKGKLDWKINLPVIKENMELIIGEIETEVVDIPTLFIRGELSNYISEEDYPIIKKQFPNSRIETIPSVGHWLHAENASLFYQIVTVFFNEEE
jgi:pimeloyl-ACP methyl ester carboxylesterase